MTIQGANLASAAVYFGPTAAKIVSDTGNQIIAISPAGTGIVDVRIVTAGGTSAASTRDQFSYILAPVVSGLTPASGPAKGGATVTISGMNLANATVLFGKTNAKIVSDTATQITVTSPGGTGKVDIEVVTAGGTSAATSKDKFTYIPTAAPANLGRSSGSQGAGSGSDRPHCVTALSSRQASPTWQSCR